MHFNEEEKALAAEEKRQEKERQEKDGPKLSNVVPLKAVREVGDRDTSDLLFQLGRASVSYYSKNGEYIASELTGLAVVAFYRDRKVRHFATGRAAEDPVTTMGHLSVLSELLRERFRDSENGD